MTMKKIRKISRMNGLDYRIILKSDLVVMFSIQGGQRFEVDRIYTLPEEQFLAYTYPKRETITNDNQFGRDGSRLFREEQEAINYFHQLNSNLGGTMEYDQKEQHQSGTKSNVKLMTKLAHRSDSTNTSSGKSHVKKLEKSFRRRNTTYNMIQRNDLVALFELVYDSAIIGYEVCRVKLIPAQVKFGNEYPMRESLPSDNEFGPDGSRAFFANQADDAYSYFERLTSLLMEIQS